MTLPTYIAATALALLLAAAPASGRPLTEAEKEALAERVASFNAMMSEDDYVALIDYLPPRIVTYVEQESGMTAAELGAAMAREMERALTRIEVEYFGMDIGTAEFSELADGEPYALIPTETVIDTGDRGRVKTRAHTLALLDGGAWYLLRIGDTPHLVILRQVYPGFAGVEFPSGSMEALK